MLTVSPTYDLLSLLLLNGVFQGILISSLLFSKARNHLPNMLLGLLILVMVLSLVEIFLNDSGLMVKVIFLYNFSESLQFLLGPLFFLFFYQLNSWKWRKLDWFHGLPFVLYSLYLMMEFGAGESQKYNSYIANYFPELPFIRVNSPVSLDPWHIRPFLTSVFIYLHLGVYILFTVFELKFYLQLKTKIDRKHFLKNFLIVCSLSAIVFLASKWFLPFISGENLTAIFITLIIYVVGFFLLKDSPFMKRETIRPQEPEEEWVIHKLAILDKAFQEDQIHLDPELNLQSLAYRVGISSHRLSKLINDHKQNNFSGLVNSYRIAAATEQLNNPAFDHLKVEEIGYRCGYGSKSAFFAAFKKACRKTPHAFRLRRKSPAS